MKSVHDLGVGLAGTALYEMVVARHSGAWDAAHTSAKALASWIVDSHPPAASLYHGVPAVAYVLQTADHRLYANALQAMDREVATIVERRLASAYARMDSGRPPRMREFDLISGLTGIGAYLLHRNSTGLLEQVLAYLVRLLTEPTTVEGQQLPGWWAHDSPRGRYDEDWPQGHANFGLAHGVAGPLALLALCARSGTVTVSGLDNALDEGCRVLTSWARPLNGGGSGWPETLGTGPFLCGPLPGVRPGRPSWCYGTPGIARALQLAALARNDAAAQRCAEQSLLTCITDHRQLSRIRDATVCHGWAGLLLAAERIAADAGKDAIKLELPHLYNRLTDYMVRQEIPKGTGLLTGADGVLLALHTLNPARPADAAWETCLLLN
ncbi:lanthionine synthetase C family protein [Streptomyces sp. NPDC054855]